MTTAVPSQVGAESSTSQATNQPIRLAEFAAAIKAHRDLQGLTLEQAAEATGVSASTLSRIERKKFHPRLETVHALCNWMGAPINKFTTTPLEDHRDTLEKVEAHFRADARLSEEAALEIMSLVRGIYALRTQSSDK